MAQDISAHVLDI